ncbi:hypothetical protein ABGB19_10210 [Mycobacterium sp. B14F4]|uniref:hypothetical protein n=1 Tax=Mycobacterium sp. B14F4 TaxID=3153565 RepID=UPI00325E2386
MVDSKAAKRTVLAGALVALSMSPLAVGVVTVPSVVAGGPPGYVEPVPPPPPNAVPAPPPPAAPAALAPAPPRCTGTDLFTGIPIPLGCVQ